MSKTKKGLSAFLSAERCPRMLELNNPVKDKILVGHEIKKMKIPSPEVCEINCFIEPECVSFNVVLLGDGTLECQLSDSDHRNNSEDMRYEAEAIYISVVVSILSTKITWRNRVRATRVNKKGLLKRKLSRYFGNT